MIEGYGYTPTYTRTELTDRLHGLFGIYTDPQIIKKAKIKILLYFITKQKLRNRL